MSWAKPRPKTSAGRPPSHNTPSENAQNEGWAIALVGGWGKLRPPDSECGETLRAASVCPRDVPGTPAAKNEHPHSTVAQPPSGKCPKRGAGYSLGGGLGPTSSAGLGMVRDFACGLRVPKIGRGHGRAQKRAPEGPRPTTPCGKCPKRGLGYSLGGALRPTSIAGLAMGRDFASGLRLPARCPRHSRAYK